MQDIIMVIMTVGGIAFGVTLLSTLQRILQTLEKILKEIERQR